MTSNIKYIGMDVHKEHADFLIMPTLGRSLLNFVLGARFRVLTTDWHSA